MNGKVERIVLADPNRSSRESLRSQLEHAGFQVRSATSGGDVLLLCGMEPPDVVIMDLAFDDMDGFELCAYVRRQTRDAETVVIVMADPADDMTKGYLGQMVEFSGGDYFFVKPFDGRLLIQLLDSLGKEGGQTVRHVRAEFPTRVVWPTTQTRRLAPIV